MNPAGMNGSRRQRSRRQESRQQGLLRKWHVLVTTAVAMAFIGLACSSGVGPGGNQGGNDAGLINDALSFEGSMSGKLVDSQSTRGATETTTLAQSAPDFDTSNTCVRFKDLAGNDLLDANGRVIGEVEVKPDGSFDATGLPVGSDFTVCGDIGKDGDCDIESCVQIPSTSGGMDGDLNNVTVDPLTTTILAKLRELIMQSGIDIRDLPISPVAVVKRVTDAYENLFAESGIEHELTLEDITNLSPDQLAELFDSVIPSGAQSGMRLVEGNLDLARARDVNAVALAAAKVFLRAGFPIVDGPDLPDLSELANLDGVEILDKEDIFGEDDGPFLDEFSDANENLPIAPAQFDEDFSDTTVYVSIFAEPDRNFENAEGGPENNGGPQLPAINDYILARLANIQLQGRRITMGQLYELLTSLDNGLGARLTYFLFDPNFFGPPLNVFETADGKGKAINLERLFSRLFAAEFDIFSPEDFDRQEVEFRALIQELLSGTIPPTFERMFGAFATDRLQSIDDIANRIRHARAHLPFSRSGPSEFYVVADGDPFLNANASKNPVTIDADVTVDGEVLSLNLNSTGQGKFYLGFTERTETDGIVELIVAETGRNLHSDRGPVRVNMNNNRLFADVNGQPFVELVSESGTFYPGTSVTVIKSDFVPMPGGFEENRFDFEGFDDEFNEFEPEDVNEEFDQEFIDEEIIDEEFIDDEFIDEEIIDEEIIDEEIIDEEIIDDPDTEPRDDDPIDEPALRENIDGPNDQIFVLATGIGPNASPVRVDYDIASGIATLNPGGRHLVMFLPDSQDTGVFALFNENAGRPSTLEDPSAFFDGPRNRPDRFEEFFNEFDEFNEFDDFENIDGFIDGFIDDLPFDEEFIDFENPDGEFDEEFIDEEFIDDEFIDDEFNDENFDDEFIDEENPDGVIDNPDDALGGDLIDPAQADENTDMAADDGTIDIIDDITDEVTDEVTDELIEEVIDEDFNDTEEVTDFAEFEEFSGFEGFVDQGLILIDVETQLAGVDLGRSSFTFVFGTEVPNPGYDPSGDPFYDDLNANGQHDENEPTAPFRATLFDSSDWRSTDIRLYYRRADNNESVLFDNINFDSDTPQTLNGVALVPRNYLPRQNAFRYSRPNTAINLLPAFLPAEFFDGTHALNRDT